MARSHHGTKKTHVKREKHRHSVAKSRKSFSLGIISYLKYKLVRASATFKKFTAFALSSLILLSFLTPVIFSITQNLQTKYPSHSIVQTSTLPSAKHILKSSFRSFQNHIPFEAIKEAAIELREKIARLKLIKMGIPDIVYLHSRQSPFPTLSDFPEVVAERTSEDDIAVDLLNAFNSDVVYECPIELQEVFCRIVQREAGNQPFLGQLILAEGVVSRVYSGAYGNSSINSILIKGYSAELDSTGKLRIYDHEGKEIVSYSENVRKSVELALQGSRVSHTILKAVTELQNAKYDLQLDDTYSNWGAIYHYSPGGLEEHQLRSRNLRRAPVSFQLDGHVFYGYWLPESAQLNL